MIGSSPRRKLSLNRGVDGLHLPLLILRADVLEVDESWDRIDGAGLGSLTIDAVDLGKPRA
jgi:hypothetical protein